MDNKTLTALNRSIEHWQNNEKAEKPEDVNLGSDTCALCDLFIDCVDCDGCPVSNKTGESACRKSPWMIAETALQQWVDDNPYHSFHAAAHAQVNFLKLLRPGVKQ